MGFDATSGLRVQHKETVTPVRQTQPQQTATQVTTQVAHNPHQSSASVRTIHSQALPAQLPAGGFPDRGVRGQQHAQSNTPVAHVQSSAGGTTAASLISSLETIRPDIHSAYVNNVRGAKAKVEEVANACIKVGREQGVDPKILFAIATQESSCGLNVRHSGSARGVTGVQPQAVTDKGANLRNPEVCIRQTAKYLKGRLVDELQGHKPNFHISPSSLSNASSNEAKLIILSYRFGAGGASGKVGNNIANVSKVAADYSRVFRHIAALH